MKRFLAVLLVAVFFLVGCNGTVPVPAEPTRGEPVEPTAVIPTNVPTETAVPSPTPTEVPTATPTPTITPTPTVTREMTVWEIARQMVVDMLPLCTQQTISAPTDSYVQYDVALGRAFLEAHPEINDPHWFVVTQGFVFTEKSGYQSPFSLFDLNPSRWGHLVDSLPANSNPESLLQDPQTPVLFTCESYGLFMEEIKENNDGDGGIEGEVWLFYEIGGEKPYVFDGDLKIIHLIFPSEP